MGPPNFESDFMEVDWVKYIPFDSTQPYTPWDVDIVSKSCPREQYPTSPVSKPEINKIANGDFEYFIKKGQQDEYGWDYDKFFAEKSDVSEVCYADETAGKDGTCGAVVSKGGYLTTSVDAAYEGYEYDLSFDGKSNGDDAVAEIVYYANWMAEGEIISSEIINLNHGDWNHYQKHLVCPARCGCISIEFYNENSSRSTTTMALDNVSLYKVK